MSERDFMTASRHYEAPSVTTIGSLHELTKQTKTFGFADGILLSIPGGNGPDVVVGIGSQ